MQRSLLNKPLESEKIEIPVAIQTYLWGQTSFFLKPKLNGKKLYGTVCVDFEKIICENRVRDLPPNLSSSINAIPRWHFVQGALPFVLHCCEALLSHRAQLGNLDRLTVAETKLLYTLHWILIKAPEEVENYAGKLHPLSIVELFVQAVVPYAKCIQAHDLTFRLQDGLGLWEALWECKVPPLKSFTSSVVFGFEKIERDKVNNGNSSTSTRNSNSVKPQGRTTFFDLAVLKCLMLPDWHEEGRVWGLQYILNYMENDDRLSQESSSLEPSLGNNQSTSTFPTKADDSFSRNSVNNSSNDTEADVSTAEKPPKTGMSSQNANVTNVDKLRRHYGFSSGQEESSLVQRRLSLKDSFRRIRNVSNSSTSSLFDTFSGMSNFRLPQVEENNVEVANGAKEFLDNFGCLKKSVILDVVCQIASQSCNARVCNLVLSVLEYLLDKHVVKTTAIATQKGSHESVPSDKEQVGTGIIGNDFDAKQNSQTSSTAKLSFQSSFQKALICVIKVVCALGCSYGCGKGIRGVTGKNLRAKTIAMMTKLHGTEQNAFKNCLRSFVEDNDVELVTGFLHALLGFCTMTLESKSTKKTMSDLFKEKPGIVGVAIDCVFAPYISKLLEFNLEEISNVTLYGQVRQLVKYVKEYAGGTFYRVVFCGLLKASGKPEKKLHGLVPEQKPAVFTTDSETPKTSGGEKIVTPKTSLRHFFPKFSRSGSSTDGSPTGNSEFGFEGSVTPLTRRKGLKRYGKKGGAMDEPLGADEEFSPGNSLDRRRKSLMKKFFKASRKKADEIFTADLRKAEAVSLTSFRRHLSSVEYTSIPVNVKEIRVGVMMFSMLLESSLPGTVPDPQVVAGILELKAPAVARGALLLECAHFVHRCNKGQWPSWLLSSHPSSRRGKGGFGALVRNAIAVSRRNVRIKHEAGLMFYKWAVAIGERLEQIEFRKKPESERKEVDSNKLLEEDFLDEGTLDEDTRKCPYALKMVACQLLLEITAFLRESHSSLAAKAETQRQKNKSIAFSRATTRRTTQKIPVFGGLKEHRDAVTSGPAERLRHVGQAMLSPVMTLPVPQVQIQDAEGEKADQKLSAPVIKVDTSPGNETEEAEKPSPSRKRFSALFSNSEKKRKLLKPGDNERKASLPGSRLNKKLPRVAHKVAGSDGSDNSDNEEEEVTRFPWLKAVAVVSGSTNFLCKHHDVCAPGCIRRQTQNCAKFMSALKTVCSTPLSQLTQNRSKKSEADKGRQCKLSTKEITIREKEKRDKIMITYLGEKVRNLFNCPMSVLIKGAVVLEPSLMLDIIPFAWELLLSPLEELVSTAAAVFLIASLHLRDVVEKMLQKELTCNSCEYQVKSLMRYGVLWRSRYHVWPRMEAGAKFVLKVPPPKLDFTLPSPPVGSCAPPVPDCPWDPKTSMENTKNDLELTEERKKKDQEETSKMVEEKKKRRTDYSFTNTSVSLEASTPADPEEGIDVITQPVTTDFWPPAMSSVVPSIIGLLDDSSITVSQISVSEMARRTLWDCLVDDPTLFFRTLFEQITKPNKQKELVFLLNKMLVHIPALPPNAGTILFNHMVGVVLFYSRRSQPCSEDAIALILSSLMWKIVPSVPNLYLKDLKYSAKKEHCERTLMVTANTPGTKKIVIVCPTLNVKTENEKVAVREDMTFEHLLQFCTAKWSLDNPLYRLLDAKSGQILEGKHLVRDVYAFKKGFPYPQLKLQLYDEQKSYVKRQEQAFTTKLAEVGRLSLALSILEAVPNWHHVSFLHSELSKQIAFPRKALDVDFALYEGGIKGMQLCAMDAIHKRMWVKLLSKLIDTMTSSFPWGDNDLHLFLNVINGALLLLCEDSSMLRLCLSTLINAAIKFNDIFAIDGYHHILPTLVLLYSHHENNDIVCSAVEFVISQFYCLHQKPFLLQLFASIEPILLTENVNKMPEDSDDTDESNKVMPKCLFTVLSSLEKEVPDSLDILALVDAEKPLQPLDSCYEGKLDSENESKIDIAIRLCVTVVAYSPESIRATQMLVVLSSILPYYLDYVKSYDGVAKQKKEAKEELTALSSLLCSVQVLLKSCNSLRRPFLKNKGMSAARKRVIEGSTGSITSFTTSHENVRQSRYIGDEEDRDVNSIDQQFKPFLNKFSTQDEGEQVLDSLYEFRTPRNAILIIVSEFISSSRKRLHELNQKNSSQNVDLCLDSESIQVLCNIAHTLLKLALTDTVSLESTGLQKFMLEALPNIDWSAEEVIPSLNQILKRINTIFTKITDKPDLMNFFWPYPLLLHRSENWNVTEVLLKGIYLTISRQVAVAALPYTKAVVATCMRLILREEISEPEMENLFNSYPPPSLPFCQLVVKLAARLMFSLKDRYSLKDLCGGTVEFGNADRTLRVLVHILLPLCIRLGIGAKGEPRASKADVSYAVSCLLNIIVTPLADVSSYARRLSNAIAMNEVVSLSPPSFVQRVLPRKTDSSSLSPSVCSAAYLGLKILIICFPDFLANEWRTIAAALKEVVLVGPGNEALWEFLDFIVLHRTPLFLLLLPLIRTKVAVLNCTSARGNTLKEALLKRLGQPSHPTPSKRAWMKSFIEELGVLTGSDQKDMFLCRNPSEPGRSAESAGTDTQSLCNKKKVDQADTRDLLEVPKQPEQKHKLSSVGDEPSAAQENTDKADQQTHYRRPMKKKVSFDKIMPLDLSETTFKELSSIDQPMLGKQKRQLPRQEVAVDIDSPISSKKLSLEYPTQSFASTRNSVGDGENIADSASETYGQSKGKKRRLGKNRKLTNESNEYEPSTETENMKGMPKDDDHTENKSRESVSETNDEMAKSLKETAGLVVSEEKSCGEKGDEKSDSIEVDDPMSFAECDPRSSEDGSGVFLLPPNQPEAAPGQRKLLEAANVVSWSRTVLDNSKETRL